MLKSESVSDDRDQPGIASKELTARQKKKRTAASSDLKKRIHIIADDRGQKSAMVDSLADFKHAHVCIRRLAIGDYQVDGRLIIERITLKDFAPSIIDGRLFTQMIRLANSALRGVLILEGSVGDMLDLGVTSGGHEGGVDHRKRVFSIALGFLPPGAWKDRIEESRALRMDQR